MSEIIDDDEKNFILSDEKLLLLLFFSFLFLKITQCVCDLSVGGLMKFHVKIRPRTVRQTVAAAEKPCFVANACVCVCVWLVLIYTNPVGLKFHLAHIRITCIITTLAGKSKS